jgi:hypothetical protein
MRIDLDFFIPLFFEKATSSCSYNGMYAFTRGVLRVHAMTSFNDLPYIDLQLVQTNRYCAGLFLRARARG